MIFCIILALTVFSHPEGFAQESAVPDKSQPKRILMLFSEGKDVPGNILLEQAIRAEMEKAGTNRFEFLTEYLDVSHFSDSNHFRFFQDYLGKKYAGRIPDLIMAFPSGDYRLAGELPDALFPDVPVLFVAVNELEVPQEISKFGVTGIVQRFDIRGTLGLILRLQPDTRRVVVIGGISDLDRAALGRIEKIASSLDGIEFEFWTNRPVAELPAAVKSLPEGTVMLLSTVLQDVNGQHFFTSQLAQLLAPPASVPVYVLTGWAVGNGALGGVVVNPQTLGARAGQLGLRLLRGERVESLPMEVAAQGTAIVDWRALQRWHIKEDRLPANSVVRYRPVTLWHEHRTLILASLAIFLAQTITIGGLLTQRRQRNRLLKLVEQRTEKLRLEILERNRLQNELLTIAEAEQRRIGHDLHDSLGQHLTAIAIACKLMAKKLAGNSPVEPATANRVVEMVEEAIGLTRNLARSLHPIDMQAGGLEHALENLAANFSKAFSVSCRFQYSGTVAFKNPIAGLYLYRIAQEAATNAIRHGRARNLDITLASTSESVMLAVTDDGEGLPVDARTRGGMGLQIMAYRAGIIGATFEVQNLPAGGTRAVCVINPVQTDAEIYETQNEHSPG